MRQWICALLLLHSYPNGVLNVAESYLGTPYAANTLETTGAERLIINEDSIDCTTFVELTVAHWLATKHDSTTFEQQMQHLRYRGGEVNGYLSRLHYFTDWVAENTLRGVWHELSPETESAIWHTDTLSLSFMSQHPQSYPYLKANAWAVDSMRAIEQRYTHYPIHYIGKEHLGLGPDELPIRDGDIVALVTTCLLYTSPSPRD